MLDGLLDFFSGGRYSSAEARLKDARSEFNQLRPPTLEELKAQYETLKSQGQMTPELEQVFLQQASEMQNISTDPRLKQAQMSALSRLMDLAENGMTLQDQANLNKMQSQIQAQERGSREAILAQMARRGASGSGVELAAMLANQQGAADRAAQAGLDIQAQAQQRALDQILQGGQLGGQIRSQDFSEQAQKAQAQDAINRFNTANRQQVFGSNIDRLNQARAQNLSEAQRIADANVGIRNNQMDQNLGARQQAYNNQFNLTSGRAGLLKDQAEFDMRRGEANSNFLGNLITQGASAWGSKK